MPSKRFDTTWQAEPHTIAKITILEAYLQAWFPIMGRTMRNQDILYIDGFAGPGEYNNYSKGSPVAAFTAAKDALEKSGQDWKAGSIHCAFIESDSKRFDHLKNVIEKITCPGHLKSHLLQSTFTNGLKQLKSKFPKVFTKTNPLFVFIDPFGATGAPFSEVVDILQSQCSEVLINFDVDGVARIFQADASASADVLLREIFGSDEWESRLTSKHNFHKLCLQALDLYKELLRRLPKVKYVFTFEMRSKSGLSYFLVFASQHPLGLEKMKEAMKKVDQTGGYSFSDARLKQTMFRFDQPEDFSLTMFNRFKGKTVRYSELRDFALNETPFTNPKAMLKALEAKHLIVVSSHDPKRRPGTFNEEKINTIIFKEVEGSGC